MTEHDALEQVAVLPSCRPGPTRDSVLAFMDRGQHGE